MKKILLTSIFVILFSMCMSGSDTKPELPGDFKVEVEQYMGLWHEIARIPNRFEKGCNQVTAEYTLLESGKVRVVNSCKKSDGEFKQSKGKAKIVKSSTDNRKLKVTFFWPFYGDYWIIDLDPDYQYVVVSDPGRKYGWILARNKDISEEKLDELVEKCKSWGLDTDSLIFANNN